MATAKQKNGTAAAVALLMSIEHFSGSHISSEHYDLVERIKEFGVIEVRMVDTLDSTSFNKIVPEGTKYVLLTTGMGFARFTIAIMQTDKGREFLEKFEAAMSA